MLVFQAQEDMMTLAIDRLPASDELIAVAKRASLYEALLSSLRRQRKPQPLPSWLYADIGLQPIRDRELIRRGP
jgi:hypothetical protein